MKKQIGFLIVTTTMLVALVSANPATDLQNSVLYIVANGWGEGHTPYYSRIGGTLAPDGTLSFSTGIQFPGEQWDDLVGTVKGRHIAFTRTRPGVFVQKFDGWFFERRYAYPEKGSLQLMAGTFSHNGVNEYGWYGWIELPQPK